jgi:exopolysaccharide production protein ExoZ
VNKTKTIWGIQYLRGLAALGVVLCHYAYGIKTNAQLLAAFEFGKYGVNVFFLISGFIISYSLESANYKPKQFFKFLLKRSIRIDPAYVFVILLTLAFFDILPLISSFKGAKIPIIPAQFFAHVFYIVPFTQYPYYVHVFWTLGIEFQFYILIGTLYFITNSKWYRMAFLLLFSVSGYFIKESGELHLLFSFAPIFALGMALVEFYKHKSINNAILPIIMLSLVVYQYGLANGILLLTSSAIIFLINTRNKVFDFMGKISYSLYLIHSLVLIILTASLKRMHADLLKMPLLWLAFEVIVAVIVAYCFYLLIEEPSLKLSKKLFYNKKPSREDNYKPFTS